jgi:hypothetical protein
MEYSLRDGRGGKGRSFKEFKVGDITIGVFQGSRNKNPELDIIVKYQKKGGNVRTPQHLHWAIDLLIKKEHDKELTKKFVGYLVGMWDKVHPFKNKQEQQKCELKFTNPENLKQFKELDKYGEYPVEFIGHIIELLMIEEKNAERSFMFKGVLDSIYEDKDIFSIVSSAGYSGR